MDRVTDILRGAGCIDAAWYTEEGRDKGTATHQACAILAGGGRILPASLDERIVGRVAAFDCFMSEKRPQVLQREFEVTNVALGIVGHPDLFCVFDGCMWVLDYKSPSHAPWHPLQLALYAACMAPRIRRANLYLHDSGRYQLVEHRDRRNDDADAMAALRMYRWRQRHGVAA